MKTPRDGWVNCPKVGVPSAVVPVFYRGQLRCRYFQGKRVIATKTVAPVRGHRFKACLGDNREWKRQGKPYATRAFCSYTHTMEQLVRSAWAWSRSYNGPRVLFGFRHRNGHRAEALGLCRAKYAGKFHYGRVWRTKCFIPVGTREITLGAGVEYMMLTKGYGRPAAWGNARINPSSVVLNPNARRDKRIGFCSFNPHHNVHLMRGVTLQVPGVMMPGRVCVAAARGKAIVSRKPTKQLILH